MHLLICPLKKQLRCDELILANVVEGLGKIAQTTRFDGMLHNDQEYVEISFVTGAQKTELIMEENRKQKLTDLGAETLADALLSIATHSSEVDDLVEHLIATPKKSVQRFKRKLSGLKRRKRFIDRRESTHFARKLTMLLQELKFGVDDPLTGVELVAAFYEADSAIFEMCDDSNGNIGDVFRYDAKELFLEYASRCNDEEKISNIILRVNQVDNYGIRDTLIDCAGECLPESVIRTMIAQLHQWAEKENSEYSRRHYLHSSESLARQIQDAELFAKFRLASAGKLSTAALIDIAEVHLECGNVETAHSWLKKIPEDETFMADERDELLQEIYQKQGNTKKLQELLFREFRSFHSIVTLQALLEVIGLDKREEVIADAVMHILESTTLKESDAEFLIAVGRVDEAEAYLLERVDLLEGRHYDQVLFLAKSMESENRHLVASVLYRCLLNSIMKRGNTNAYGHGVRYLNKLDKLAVVVADWKAFDHHEKYKAQLVEANGRKYSFWSKYEDANY